MTDDEYLKSVRRGLKASVRFFESANRQRREKYVVREFLRNLGLRVLVRDLKAVRHDPPDVRFRGCEFEIKEHMDAGRPRHREYKEALAEASKETSPSKLLIPFTPKDISAAELYARILADARELARVKYPTEVRRNLDPLVYVNLQDVMGIKDTSLPNSSSLAALGWRSVSFLKGHWSCVLTASENAPTLLRSIAGQLIHRKPPRRSPRQTRRLAAMVRRHW